MNVLNDPIVQDSDMRTIESAIREAAETFGLHRFAQALADSPEELHKAA